MRVIYRGYALTTYGTSMMSISNPEGRQIFTTSDRSSIIKTETDIGLKQYLKDFIKEYENASINSNEELHNSNV